MSERENLDRWIQGLREGDPEAAEALWTECLGELIRFARSRMQSLPRCDRDEEDVVLSAIDTFIRRMKGGKFVQIEDGEDVWRVLYDVTRKRIAREYRQKHAIKRGGGKVMTITAASTPDGQSRREWSHEPHDAKQEFSDMLFRSCNDLFDALLRIPNGKGLLEVARCRLSGYTVQEIADQLQVSKRTAERRLELVRLVCEEALNE